MQSPAIATSMPIVPNLLARSCIHFGSLLATRRLKSKGRFLQGGYAKRRGVCCNTAGGLLWTCACLKSRPLRLRFECERVLHCGRTCSYSPFEHSSHQRTPAAVSPAPRNAGVDGSPTRTDWVTP